ncbi:MAG: hypothetical protein ABEH65_01680 [Halobacteriales archaeon]
MTIRRVIRRLFIRRIAEGIIGFAGVVLGLRWVETGLVDNTGATAAARTFNQAIVDHRNGRERFQEARDIFERNAWAEAKVAFREAHNEYYQAAGKYEDAHAVATDASCDRIADSAKQYMRYCRMMDNVCTAWNEAARLMEEGKAQEAKSREESAKTILENAIRSVDPQIPKERNPQNPLC